MRNIYKDNIKTVKIALFTLLTKTFAYTLPFYCLYEKLRSGGHMLRRQSVRRHIFTKIV
jgi:hypothetical protein